MLVWQKDIRGLPWSTSAPRRGRGSKFGPNSLNGSVESVDSQTMLQSFYQFKNYSTSQLLLVFLVWLSQCWMRMMALLVIWMVWFSSCPQGLQYSVNTIYTTLDAPNALINVFSYSILSWVILFSLLSLHWSPITLLVNCFIVHAIPATVCVWPYSLLIAMFINGDIGREWKIPTYIKTKPKSERAM